VRVCVCVRVCVRVHSCGSCVCVCKCDRGAFVGTRACVGLVGGLLATVSDFVCVALYEAPASFFGRHASPGL
jgi:hypothetical protein